MKKYLKKILGITGSFLAIGVIAIGAGVGVVSCSSPNQTTSTTITPASSNTSSSNNSSTDSATNSSQKTSSSPSSKTSSTSSTSNSSSNVNNSQPTTNNNNTKSASSTSSSASSSSLNPHNSSSSSSGSSSSSKSQKETNSSSSSSSSSHSQTPPSHPNPYPNGLVTISSSLTPNQNGQQLSTNDYACGSSITLTANYTYPTDQDVNQNGSLYFEWFANGKQIYSGTNLTYNVGSVVVNTTYSVQAYYMVTSNQQGVAPVTYQCKSSKINVTINYNNLVLGLAYNDGNTKTITTSNQVTLDASLQYTLPNTNQSTYFTNTQLTSLSDVTINFARYSFSTWNNLNDSTNDNGAIAKNYELVTTPDGVYPFRASFTINGKTIYSNILKVNTSYNGSILNFANLPSALQTTYNYPALMQKYIVQSMDHPNSLFMQLVNAEYQVYRIIPITSNNSMTASQFNKLSVSASDFSNISVKWFDAKNHDEGLLVSATVNAKNGIELFSYQNLNYGSYDVSVGNGNNSITNGNIISWLLPYGDNELNWWSQNPNNVMNQNINWNLNSNIYMQNGGELFNSNFDTHGVNSNNWQFYSPNWMYPTVSFKTVTKGVYWGFTITTPNGSNALHGILASNYYEVNVGNGNYQTIYGGTGATYIAYENFPMIQSSATAETGYLTLLSSCTQMLQDLYDESIASISTLN